MTPPANAERYKNHRFPVEIISHGVWLYYRFTLSYRDVQELLFERGITVSHEAIRKWCRKFGQAYANQLRRRRPRPGDKWHLDEVFLTIHGERYYLWRAVDQDDNILDILDVHFVNPSPVFLLDKAGDCRHLETILRAVLPDPQTRMAPMPAPYAPPVTLAAEEQAQLEALTRAHATPQALAFRCRLILRAAAPEHPSNLRLATEMHCDRHTVRLWRTRYLAQGLEGLQDAPRSGRPRRFSPR